ncbi:MAG TPA: tRNA (N(6)-L-threonylcarbamoyladenosine(37)-C(2))-methylthiotransferase MtaB [Coriobacteriia bacterium]|nr:tRNA (N(6)-L-threonylcarbamoyladenosine(37)-C(2))-methylthiotransferase MtaB [Coriobacteriia bacterium]
MSGLKVAFRTLGCKVNRVESEDIAADLLGRGIQLAEEDAASVIVVNTCTVTGEADAKARKAVRQALKAAGEPLVVVTGCLAALDAEGLEALGERVIAEPDKERVASRVAEALGLESEEPHGHAVRSGQGFRTRALLKIEDGCDNFCSYCIVPHARGVPCSVPLARIAEQVAALVAAGAAEIVLTGINIGRYSDGDADLASVVETVAAAGVSRLRLSSVEPPDVTDRLLAVLAATPAACPHLHVPLQSGSDAVLEAMGRKYAVADYRAMVERARAALPGLALTTDVIAGFPTETEEQAAETAAFVREIGFAKLHVFRYSQRPGTPAAEMPQVTPEARASRAETLRQAGDAMRDAFTDARLGSLTELLVEKVGENDTAEGTTPDYLRVALSGAPGLSEGDLVSVRLKRRLGSIVLAELA